VQVTLRSLRLPPGLRPQDPPQFHRRKPDRRHRIRFLGISPGFFLRLQLHHGLELANRQHGKEINRIRPLQPASTVSNIEWKIPRLRIVSGHLQCL
jgi:hypothetical protein